MGRFDEWFADDANLASKESEHDSTQRETPATVEADAGGAPEHGNTGSDSFSILEEQPAAKADSHDNFADSNGGLTPDAGESDIAILPSSPGWQRTDSTVKKHAITGIKPLTTKSAQTGC